MEWDASAASMERFVGVKYSMGIAMLMYIIVLAAFTGCEPFGSLPTWCVTLWVSTCLTSTGNRQLLELWGPQHRAAVADMLHDPHARAK